MAIAVRLTKSRVVKVEVGRVSTKGLRLARVAIGPSTRRAGSGPVAVVSKLASTNPWASADVFFFRMANGVVAEPGNAPTNKTNGADHKCFTDHLSARNNSVTDDSCS